MYPTTLEEPQSFSYEMMAKDCEALEKFLGSLFVSPESRYGRLCQEVSAWLMRLFDASADLAAFRARRAYERRDVREHIEIELNHIYEARTGSDTVDYSLQRERLETLGQILEREMASGVDCGFAKTLLGKFDLSRIDNEEAAFRSLIRDMRYNVEMNEGCGALEIAEEHRFLKEDEMLDKCREVIDIVREIKSLLENSSEEELEQDANGVINALWKAMMRGERIYRCLIAMEESKTPRKSLRIAKKRRFE